jgi:hypothetical protein
MSYDDNQNEYPLPVPGQEDKRTRTSAEHLPRYFRTSHNKKFLQGTLDQLTQPGVAEKISAYYGRRISKARKAADNYVGDVSTQRENYQLEPATVIKDELNNVTFYKDYNDLKNQIKAFNGTVDNDSKLFSQEYYAWNPNIDWDKFTNFRDYYWLENGPLSIPVVGQARGLVSTYTVTSQDNLDNKAYIFSTDGNTSNPTLKLYRGQTYKFDINTPGMPLSIKTARTLDSQYNYSVGISDSTHSTDVGIIEFEVDLLAPDTLYYVNGNDINASGLIQVYDILENTEIDVEKEIVGKKTYKMTNGYELSNGMKLDFQGTVTPAKYAEGNWYVEGVGDEIRLINEQEIEVPGTVSTNKSIPFDSESFDRAPFSNANAWAKDKDYIIQNRASPSKSQWSRYNRWFHKDVLETIALINKQPSDVNQTGRAARPIIEFDSDLKLWNFGTSAKDNVDLLDTFTTDVFSTIEGALGYNIDGVDVADGMRLLFTADPDTRVAGKIFKVKFITHNFIRQISLIEETDTDPLENETVLINDGTDYKGKMWYFNGTKWLAGQDKTAINQSPTFDLFDQSGNSFNSATIYNNSTFSGTKVFSYKKGTGTNDVVLGFPLTYRALENTGDIVFDFNLLQDSFTYQDEDNANVTANTDVGLLRRYSDRTTFTYTSGWTKGYEDSKQLVERQYIVDTQYNDFGIDVYDNSGDLNDLFVRVYVNNKRKMNGIDYTINRINRTAFVTFVTDLKVDDILVIKTKSATKKNANGVYEIASNLEHNPLNNNIDSFTLGEVNDHVLSICEMRDDFVGDFPGTGNLRDLGNLSAYGNRFVQHSGPFNLANYHITSKDANIIKSLQFAKREYGKFRKLFLQTADKLGFDGQNKIHFDLVMEKLNKDKSNDMPFYFSDMLGYTSAKRSTHVVENPSTQYYALNTAFDLTTLSNKSVNVYINGVQLIEGTDYKFESDFSGFVTITKTKVINDVIDIYEYNTTDGSYIPATPTKLGLYPKFKPEIFTDTTYQVPTKVIQGHDGSIFVAYEDFRDDLLLELEKRIYNNIKVEYDATMINIFEFIGGESRDTTFTRSARDKSLLPEFIEWNNAVGSPDYADNSFWSRTNSFTFNYSNTNSPSGKQNAGYWRAIYKEAYDTDRPHTHPWEILGYSEEPTWWQTVYGAAPYTSENKILWQDIEKGAYRIPNEPVTYNSKYARANITKHIPVDDGGELLSPLDSNYAKDYISNRTQQTFVFGDQAPTETAWRRSSEYPFALMIAWLLNQPTKILGLGYDRSRIKRNPAKEVIYSETNKRLRLEDVVFPNTTSDTIRVQTAGLVNYVHDYMNSRTVKYYKNYQTDLKNVTNQLGLKIGGFTDKSKFKLILDSRTPFNEGNVFVPEENYQIFLNKSSVIDLVPYSGVIIEKVQGGFVIRGYNYNNPYFKYYSPISLADDPVVRVGGVSADFVTWTEGQSYSPGLIVEFGGRYFMTESQHIAAESFDQTKFVAMPELPVEGGRTAVFHRQWNEGINDEPLELAYGTQLQTIQQVVDFLLGYERYLKVQGFVFENYNTDINEVEDWRLSAKEYMFWTTQNWAEKSVITLSAGANKICYYKKYHVADDIFDNFYGYNLFKADGKKLIPAYASVYRDNDNRIEITTKNTPDGIFSVKLPLVQTEHVVLLDNTTVFKDYIYDLEPGYRQSRIKVMGYRTDKWTGGFNIPGFIYDNAKVTEWAEWTDYAVGDTVKHKEFYYVAKVKIPGQLNFDAKQWERLDKRPEPGLMANFDYKAKQFEDFYDLDTDNFDTSQQRVAQHLIGYQKRKYLENIINDDVSQYKFYQGFIQDKGTKNSLTKLFDALSNTDADSVEFHEEWALRLGQIGAAQSFDEVEYKLDEAKFRLSPQPVALVDSVTGTETDLIYRQRPFETYLKPDGYNHKPFPTKYKDVDYIQTAGYVNPSDVKTQVANYDAILNIAITTLNVGDYIWTGTNKTNDWDVFKYLRTEDKVIKLTKNSTTDEVEVKLNNQARYVKDDIIGLVDVTDNERFYKVLRSELDTVFCTENGKTTDVDPATGFVTNFTSVRVADLEAANTKLINSEIKVGETIWVDDDSSSKWVVIKNNPVHSQHQVISNVETSDITTNFGKVIACDERNSTLVVGASESNKVYIYNRTNDGGQYIHAQTLDAPTGIYTGDGKFGTGLALSRDSKWLVVGAPQASNVKTKFAGSFTGAQSYVKNDIVNYQENFWEAQFPIAQAQGTLTFNSFYDTATVAEASWNGSNYPEVVYAVRGNYHFNVPTDHMLIRAPLSQYEATAAGDTIVLNWDQYSQNYPAGILPFGSNGPGVAQFEGSKTIASKVDAILYFDNMLRTPNVGDTISTTTAIGTVDYIHVENVNQATIYIKDMNGEFTDSGSATLGTQNMGTYVALNPLNSGATFGGWWKVTGLTSFTSSVKSVTTPQFVVQDIITQSESKSPEVYYNTMDDVYALNQVSDPTKGGKLGHLSFYNKQGMPDLSPYWFFRANKAWTDTLNTGDTFKMYVNKVRNSLNTVFDPATLGINTNYINQALGHEVYDLWDGYVDVTFTNFDNQGNAFIPQIGQTIIDQNTNATGEVVYVQEQLLDCRVYVKNRSGTFSFGNLHSATSTIAIKDGVSAGIDRLSGRLDNMDMSSSLTGKLVVVRFTDSTQLPVTTPTFRNEVEIQVYNDRTVNGVARTPNYPNPLNKDWKQVSALKTDSTGSASSFTNEGVYFVYEKMGTGLYSYQHGYTNPQRASNRNLGTQIELCKSNTITDFYRLYVSAPGNLDVSNSGRIHFVNHGTDADGTVYEWGRSKNLFFRGEYDVAQTYYTDDIVLYQGSFYQAKTNLTPGAFVLTYWTLLANNIDYIGYVPNDTGLSVSDDSTFDKGNLIQYAHPFSISKYGDVLATVADFNNSDPKIIIYRINNGHYEFSQMLPAPTVGIKYGSAISLNDTGDMLAVGAPEDDTRSDNNGKVFVYTSVGGVFSQTQTLYSPENDVAERFGAAIDFEGNDLIVSSKGGDLVTSTTFDVLSTTFDNNLTQFESVNTDSGQVFMYQKVQNKLLYAEKFNYKNASVERFGEYLLFNENHVYVPMPELSVRDMEDSSTWNNYIGTLLDYKRDREALPWQTLHTPTDQVDLTKFKGVFIYTMGPNPIAQKIDYIDPIQGKIAGAAEEELTFKTHYDPAVYTNGTNTPNTVIDPENYWNNANVGRLWWDISTAKFVNPYQGNIIYNTANWNKLFTGASIDVYEWVESTLTPTQWNETADTEEGLVKGISGTAKDVNTFVQVQVYNEISKGFSNKYYYWVKNTKVIPDLEWRKTSAYDVAQLITDPMAMGQKFVALYSNNKFGLYNCESLVSGPDNAINFRYWTIDNKEINIHNQYQLMSEGLGTSKPNADIERKWYDSLIGVDTNERPVPDTILSEKQKYGILDRPRQGMFKNRVEALKQVVERANTTLKANLIVDELNLSAFLSKDPTPTLLSKQFDKSVTTNAELQFVGVSNVIPAVLTPVFVNGKLERVDIANGGKGYVTVPTYEFGLVGNGSGAEITITMNTAGTITNVAVKNAGSGYPSTTTLSVRKYSVLVAVDETVSNKWAIYAYNNTTKLWERTSSSSYDTTKWWSYTDWYDIGYSEFTDINFLVDYSYELESLTDTVGDIVKISTIGSGGWLLLEKISDIGTDYTTKYKTVGRQNGTIALSRALYDPASSNIGYDGLSYDTSFYDDQPTLELRKILTALRDDIFINDLAVHYNELFFASLRYAFSEQPMVDWAFKTSFLKAKHNAGDLTQKITFQNDSLPSYEDFVEEAKPYKTKIREYISSYTKTDPTATGVTDFDIPPAYSIDDGKIVPSSLKVKDDLIYGQDANIVDYPNKYWAENVGFEVLTVNIKNGGTGYLDVPVIKFTGGGGSGATATATLGTGGAIKYITVTNPGSGYLSAPTVSINGTQSTGSVAAVVSAQLGNSKVRALHHVSKFDRVTGTFLITTLSQTENFTGTGSKTTFNLTWPMDLRKTQIEVTVDGVESLQSEYTYSNVEYSDKSYVRTKGQIMFAEPPANNAVIVVKYSKEITMLQAQDRINLFYTPSTGMLGNDVSQLMDGIDYGGIEVKSFTFGAGTGWASDPYYTTTWDTYDNTYEDEVFVLDGSTNVFALAKPLANGVVYNVYKNGIRVDDPQYDGSTVPTNVNAVMQSITGTGQTTVQLDEEKIPTVANDVIVIRKASSDGSFIPDPDGYDTLVQGGDLAYATAKGISAEEIVIDGDGFVTPLTSKGPEELVPGQVLDTLDIKVYERTGDGSSVLHSYNYLGDGTNKDFDINYVPLSQKDVWVKVHGTILSHSEFTVDYQNKKLKLTTAPGDKQQVHIITMSNNGEKILDVDQFIGDGSTAQFVTSIPFKSTLSFFLTVDGVTTNVDMAETDGTYAQKGMCVFKLGTAPLNSTVIQYAIFDSASKSFSQIATDTFTGDGTNKEFALAQTPLNQKPLEHNVIVKVGNKVLNAGYNQQFKVTTGVREYQLRDYQITQAGVGANQVRVFLNGTELTLSTAWNWNTFNASVELFSDIGVDGDVLDVYVIDGGEYAFGFLDGNGLWVETPGKVYLDTAPANNESVTVYQLTNHDVRQIERENLDIVTRNPITVGTDNYTEYHQLTNGIIKLRKAAIDAEYVWLVVNGALLTPSVDYYLQDDKQTIRVVVDLNANDVIELIHFSNSTIVGKFGFRQFKDMLNRTHFKRLGDDVEYTLAQNLNWYDTKIFVTNADGLPQPNRDKGIPGIIFIGGERIEYYLKEEGAIRQLRRGTLGTGIKTLHTAGAQVLDQSVYQTVPYKDEMRTQTFTADGSTRAVTVDFIPNNVNEFEIFVGGRRLRKNAISSFNPSNDLDSPEGDITLPAEFSVDGVNPVVTLTDTPAINTKIMVVRRIGKKWTDNGTPLRLQENNIGRFLRNKEVALPK